MKPSHARYRLNHQEYSLGDRVIYCLDSGSVPIAIKGTVVGLEGIYVEVLFDSSFMGGLDLGGRCSPHRGMTVKKDTLLNLSNHQSPQASARNLETIQPKKSVGRVPGKSGYAFRSSNGMILRVLLRGIRFGLLVIGH